MKLPLALALAVILCASGAHAQKPKIEAVLAKDKDSKSTSTFPADVPKIFAFFKSTGTKKGDNLRAVWIAVDVGDKAPKGTKIDETAVTADRDNVAGSFSLSQPAKGWPAGEYRADIYHGSKLATTVKFSIEEAATAKADEGDTESKPSAGDEGEYTFRVKNTTEVKITKLLASEDGTVYGDFDVGSGIAPGTTMTLSWDKKTNDSDCEWYFKAKFGDGSESEVMKIDFCEEDLEMEF